MRIIAIVLAILLLPVAFAQVSDGVGVGVDITTEGFAPLIWMCDSRVVMDDATAPGRVSDDGEELVERINNYAFEGEQIQWKVLVMDKNGIGDITSVVGTVDLTQGTGNDVEVSCVEDLAHSASDTIDSSCNARILEESITSFNPLMMRYYDCILSVETPASMYGEHWITVEATEQSGASSIIDENEYWFLNPVIGLTIDDTIDFLNVRPGTDSYSSTILVENTATSNSGVMLDMFISGTDFYDSASSGAMCPTSNQLELSNFRYYAVNGAYSTAGDDEVDVPAGRGDRNVDAEGYVNIGYGIGFNNPTTFYDGFEVIQDQHSATTPYYSANLLAPNAEMAITFKLSLPEPCNGDFDSGKIYFWAEAI